MTVAEIKEYAHTIAEYIKNYREVCREEGGNEERIPTTPLQNDIEHLVSMLDELDIDWIETKNKFPDDEDIEMCTEFLVKAENSEGNLINTVVTCTKADKENREWTFGRYERKNDNPIFTVYEVIAWKYIGQYKRK